MSTTNDVELVGEEIAENIARAALFAALIGAFAYVSFPTPLSPVPVTLQVMGVFLAGVFLGPTWGFLSLVLYIVAGGIGAPIFSGGSSGIGVLVGPTAGYIWSWPIAAAIVGYVSHGGLNLKPIKELDTLRMLAGMILATIIIYLFGLVGFAFIQGVGFYEALTLTVVPFIPFESVKIIAVLGIVRSDVIAAR